DTRIGGPVVPRLHHPSRTTPQPDRDRPAPPRSTRHGQRVSTADDLEHALAAHVQATGAAPEGWIPTHWVIVGVSVGPEPDQSCHWRIYPGDRQARHVTLGLLDMAVTFERDDALTDADEE